MNDQEVRLLPRSESESRQYCPAEWTAAAELNLQFKRAGILLAKKRRFDEKTGEFDPEVLAKHARRRKSAAENAEPKPTTRRPKGNRRNGLKR